MLRLYWDFFLLVIWGVRQTAFKNAFKARITQPGWYAVWHLEILFVISNDVSVWHVRHHNCFFIWRFRIMGSLTCELALRRRVHVFYSIGAKKRNLVVGVYYQLPNQGEHAGESSENKLQTFQKHDGGFQLSWYLLGGKLCQLRPFQEIPALYGR